MNILILGGTKFYGRHLVDSALARGHTVTLFNRGKTNPGLFPQVETILGDREHDIAKLAGRTWDAVVDVAGYLPRIVRLSASSLREAGAVGRYVYISSVSAYADLHPSGIDESHPVGKLEDETVEEITEVTYGPLKALCEKTVMDLYGERALVIRPGLIVGPHDPTDRFTYWPVRVARGGDVLAPVNGDEPTQVIDVRDLSDWTIRLIEAGASGIYNAIDVTCPLGELLETCKRVSGSEAHFVWAPEDVLKKFEVAPWMELTVWVPEEEGAGQSRISNAKAVASGLACRPLEETVRDTLAWANTRPSDHVWRAGLAKEKEDRVLAALKGG